MLDHPTLVDDGRFEKYKKVKKYKKGLERP